MFFEAMTGENDIVNYPFYNVFLELPNWRFYTNIPQVKKEYLKLKLE